MKQKNIDLLSIRHLYVISRVGDLKARNIDVYAKTVMETVDVLTSFPSCLYERKINECLFIIHSSSVDVMDIKNYALGGRNIIYVAERETVRNRISSETESMLVGVEMEDDVFLNAGSLLNCIKKYLFTGNLESVW